MIVTKKDLIKKVVNFCNDKRSPCDNAGRNCKKADCSLFPIFKSKGPDQCDMFRVTDSDIFMSMIFEAAESFEGNPFYWSDLRNKVQLNPLHNNWWGVSTRMLKKRGYRILEGARKSKFKSRCGAMDRKWQKTN